MRLLGARDSMIEQAVLVAKYVLILGDEAWVVFVQRALAELGEADCIFQLFDFAGYRRIEVGNSEGDDHGLRVDRFHLRADYKWHFTVAGFRDIRHSNQGYLGGGHLDVLESHCRSERVVVGR